MYSHSTVSNVYETLSVFSVISVVNNPV